MRLSSSSVDTDSSGSGSSTPTFTVEQLGIDLPPDDANTILITALLIQDLAELSLTRKGKGRVDATPSDEAVAFALFESEARGVVSTLQDGVIARSVDAAIETDRDLLRELSRLEVQAQMDRDYAQALARGEMPPSVPPQRDEDGNFGPADSLFEPTGSTNGKVTTRRPGVRFSSSSTANAGTAESVEWCEGGIALPKKSGESSRRAIDCTICGDRIRGTRYIRMPCDHPYDVECARDLFSASIKDESLFPPRCCRQEIPVALITPYVTAAFLRSFENKRQEFTTVNRLYCSNATCSRFLGAAANTTDTPRGVPCGRCGDNTCASCKLPAHAAHIPCVTDDAAQQLLTLARESGWMQCPSCHTMVELSVGCYHMTCRCNHQFCYVCAAQWKTCQCPQWDENRLLHIAQRQVEREQQYADRNIPQVDVQQAVRRAAERLRVDHECAHTDWRLRHGGGPCESCGNHLANYLLRCTGCQMLACVRCQRNRL